MALKEVGVRLVAEGGASFLSTLEQGERGVKNFADTAEKAKGGISNFASSAVSSLETLGKAALALGAVGVTALGAFFISSIQEAAEAEEAQAQLAAVLKSTGQQAGVTAEMANQLASEYQLLTKFSDDQILSAENLLLTFTNINQDIFPETVGLALDMSEALGQDLKSSSIQLGKALNDPIEGLTALKRVGVSFTTEQEKLIRGLVEMGDTAGAQRVILEELKKEFGGSATAAGQTFTGQLAILQHKLSDVKETIGNILLPILNALIDGFTTIIGPVAAFIETIASADDPFAALLDAVNSIIPGFDGILAAMQPVIDIAMEIGSFLGDNLEPILISLAAVIGGAVVVALGSMAAAMVAAAAPIIALVAVGAALYKAWQENFLGIRDIVTSALQAIWSVIQSVLGVVQGFVQQHGESIKTFFLETWESIKGIVQGALEIINGTIVPILSGIADFISAHKETIVSVLSAAWEIIKTVITTVLGVIQGVINTILAVIQGDWSGAWEAIQGVLNTVWEAIKTIVSQGLAVIQLVLSLAWQAIKGAAESVWNSISKSISDIWEGIKKFISESVNAIPGIILGIGKELYDAGAAIIQQMWDGITSVFRGVLDDVRAKVKEIKDLVASVVGGSINQQLQQVVPPPAPRALGGPVKAMSRYLVGERGPELFVPGRSGTILPTDVTQGLVEGAIAAVSAINPRAIAPPASSSQIAQNAVYNNQNNYNFNFQANYSGYQSESSLIQDVKMMQMLRPEL